MVQTEAYKTGYTLGSKAAMGYLRDKGAFDHLYKVMPRATINDLMDFEAGVTEGAREAHKSLYHHVLFVSPTAMGVTVLQPTMGAFRIKVTVETRQPSAYYDLSFQFMPSLREQDLVDAVCKYLGLPKGATRKAVAIEGGGYTIHYTYSQPVKLTPSQQKAVDSIKRTLTAGGREVVKESMDNLGGGKVSLSITIKAPYFDEHYTLFIGTKGGVSAITRDRRYVKGILASIEGQR